MTNPPHARFPLGLPSGSVRALLTLIILAVVVGEILRGEKIEIFWTEALMIALAHYFTSRRFLSLTPEVMARLEEEGHLPKESNPLWLPKHTVRIVIFLTFVGVTAWLYRAQRLWHSEALTVIGTVFAYLLGVSVQAFLAWWTRKTDRTISPKWEDAKAIVVLLALGIVAAAYFLNLDAHVPEPARKVAIMLVLFYFGSR